LADFPSLAKSLSQLKQGYYCSHLSVCVSQGEKINSPNSKVEYNSNHSSDLLKILNLSLGDQTKMKFGLKYEMKTTSDGRQPQNSKRGISQQPMIGSSSNFKLKLRGPKQNKIWLEI
jgi:hypothetical protein